MTKFMASGAHAKAMKIMNEIALDGATVFGYESDDLPPWDEALTIWKEKGIRHGIHPTNKRKNIAVKKSESKTQYLPTLLGVVVAMCCIVGSSFIKQQYITS